MAHGEGNFEAAFTWNFLRNPTTELEFDKDQVMLFTGPEGKLVIPLRGFLATLSNEMGEKRETLEEHMKENPKWPGCGGVIDEGTVEPTMLAELFGGESVFRGGGGKVWMRLFKNNSCNKGVKYNFLPGCACFYFARANAAFTCILLPMAPFIDKGVDTFGLDKYLDEEAGLAAFSKHAVVVHLSAWDLLYVPIGHLCWTVTIQLNGEKLKNFGFA